MRITLPSGTPAEIARPPGEPTRGLVVVPDIGGLRPLFDDHVARLAADNGWTVCAFELWPGREHLDLADRLAAGGSLDDERVLGDAVDAADATGVEAVSIVGFCMGGMYALKAAGTGRFARAASFYGMARVPEMWQSPTQGEPLTAVAGAGPARPSRSRGRPTRGCPRATWRRWRRPASRSSGTRAPTTASPTTPTARPTARTTRPTRGAGSSPTCPGSDPSGDRPRRPGPGPQRARRSSCSRSVIR